MPAQLPEVPKMPVIFTDFDTYQYGYVSDAGFTGSVNACEINCYKSNTQVARICLIKAGLPLPANAVHSGVLYLYFPLSQFGDIIGIFRYEKAINISLDTDTSVGEINNAVEKPGKKLPG
jgi:hypothetical protein